jgi:hypothetical protein
MHDTDELHRDAPLPQGIAQTPATGGSSTTHESECKLVNPCVCTLRETVHVSPHDFHNRAHE